MPGPVPPLNSADLNTSLDAVKATYERLIRGGIDPAVVVIAMSEIIAFCLAHKALTGGDEEETYRTWLLPFESSYRVHLEDQKAKKR